MSQHDSMHNGPDDLGDASLPLGVGEQPTDGLDPLSTAGEKRKIPSGTIVIIAVVLLAVGGLMAMRGLATVTRGAGRDEGLEKTIEAFLSSFGPAEASAQESGAATDLESDEEVLRVLIDDYTERQVGLADLQRDPFVLYSEMYDSPADLPTIPTGPSQRERMRQERRAEIQKAGSRLELKSVMMGADPLANVSGNIVRLNEPFAAPGLRGVELAATDIQRDGVTLVAHDPDLDVEVMITLVIDQQ